MSAEPEFAESHLSDILTNWSDIRAAHVLGAQARSAQKRLIHRYETAIKRYLCILVRNPDAADDLYQEFVSKLLAGQFHAASPDRGMFRKYVKSTLIHMVNDYKRRLARQPSTLEGAVLEAIPEPDRAEAESASFDAIWSASLLSQALEDLQKIEMETGKPVFQALSVKIHHPECRSAELATRLHPRDGRTITVGDYRKILHKARELLAERIVHHVQESLGYPGLDAVEEELIELGLMRHCRKVVEQRRST